MAEDTDLTPLIFVVVSSSLISRLVSFPGCGWGHENKAFPSFVFSDTTVVLDDAQSVGCKGNSLGFSVSSIVGGIVISYEMMSFGPCSSMGGILDVVSSGSVTTAGVISAAVRAVSISVSVFSVVVKFGYILYWPSWL